MADTDALRIDFSRSLYDADAIRDEKESKRFSLELFRETVHMNFVRIPLRSELKKNIISETINNSIP